MASYLRSRQLRAKRRTVLEQARTICEDAHDRGDAVLSGEDEHRYQQAVADIDKLDLAIVEAEHDEERASDTKAAGDKFAGGLSDGRELRVEDNAFTRELWEAVQPGHKEAVGWDLPGSSFHALTSEASGPVDHDMRAVAASVERRTDVPYTSIDASTTYSSYAVPNLMANYIETKAYAASGVLQAGPHVFSTDSIAPYYIPKVVTDPTITVSQAEGTQDTDSAYAVLGRTTLKAWRHDAYSVLTEEDIASSGPDILTFVMQSLGAYVAMKVASSLAVGVGTTVPHGLFKAAPTGATSATGSPTTFTAGNLISTYQSIMAAYRPGLRCVASQAAESIIMQLVDDMGRYMYQSGLAFGAPNSLLGIPLSIDPQGPACTASNTVVVFLQPEHFHVRYGMGGGVRVDVSTDYLFPKFCRVLRVGCWVDSELGVAGAASGLTLAAS